MRDTMTSIYAPRRIALASALRQPRLPVAWTSDHYLSACAVADMLWPELHLTLRSAGITLRDHLGLDEQTFRNVFLLGACEDCVRPTDIATKLEGVG